MKTSTLKKLTLFTAVNFVIANMVGTGVFTSLGFQLADLSNIAAILMLWVIGGILALFGAMAYGELGAAMPRSGGEYNFLSRIYHPSVGFLGGWVSATIGFAAPVALASMAFGEYFNRVLPEVSPMLSAIIILSIITAVHSWDIKSGGQFQNIFTVAKIAFVILFIVAGLFFAPETQNISLSIDSGTWADVFTPAFFVALIYVSYAYSGWNASAYFVNDLKNPVKQLPKSLLVGTIVVTALYVLLNFVFLLVAPAAEMTGQLEVGFIAANYIFGVNVGQMMSIAISLLLVSSISSMVFAGPRVTQVMGEDFKLLSFLGKKTKRNVPMTAVLLQFAISFVLIITASFDQLITYTGFVLNIFTFLTVMGVYVHRIKYKDADRPVKTWGYPVTPFIFMAFNLAIGVFLVIERPVESLIGLGTIAVGAILYFFSQQSNKKTK
ncbi:MAG: amino acid permease [Marinilabiliales bacterium]|nr:MAG: amino acid permease [Marinilabiliales bacterium]